MFGVVSCRIDEHHIHTLYEAQAEGVRTLKEHIGNRDGTEPLLRVCCLQVNQERLERNFRRVHRACGRGEDGKRTKRGCESIAR